jgi:homoserine O-acetyltransferase
VDFEVESYLHHQGTSFLKRFDADSYLYLTRVMDYFDAFADPAATARALAASDTRYLVLSFDSDWRFDTAHSREIVRVLSAAGAHVTFQEIPSPHGHDSFLLEIPEYHRTVAAYLDRLHRETAP